MEYPIPPLYYWKRYKEYDEKGRYVKLCCVSYSTNYRGIPLGIYKVLQLPNWDIYGTIFDGVNTCGLNRI